MSEHRARGITFRSFVAAASLASLVSVMLPSTTAVAGDTVATRRQALHRLDVIRINDTLRSLLRTNAPDDATYDMRGSVSIAVPSQDETAISIGKDDPAARTVVVGATVDGAIDESLTWQEVKSRYDGEGLRLEGTDWFAVYGLRVDDVEDGFAPRTRDGSQSGSTDHWLLDSAYMTYIRDDCVEDDDLLSGEIRDSFLECNRFLSARPSSGSNYENHNMVVTVEHTLVHMKSMPHEDAPDGMGHGSPFKWDDTAGRVALDHVLILVDEQPVSSTDFPPGTYRHVKLVLGPDFQGGWSSSLPDGVRVTRNMHVWTRAARRWRAQHSVDDRI